jgi:hypothetical protein
MKARISALLILILNCGLLSAQNKEVPDAIGELRKLMQAYRNVSQLSFDIGYYYSDSKNPAEVLDSLEGSCKMKGSSYWTTIDQTETLCSNGMVVVLYKEDQIMYLAKPSAAMQLGPLALADSFFAQKHLYNCTMTQDKAEKRIIVDFKDASVYKRVEYFIDRKSGFITRMVSTVRSEQMSDPAVRSLADSDSWSIVEMRMRNYKTQGLDEKTFDPGRYFKKEESGYVTLPPYDTYKIFIGSPNL